MFIDVFRSGILGVTSVLFSVLISTTSFSEEFTNQIKNIFTGAKNLAFANLPHKRLANKNFSRVWFFFLLAASAYSFQSALHEVLQLTVHEKFHLLKTTHSITEEIQ